MIAEYEDENRDLKHDSERIYGLNLRHKHLPEMEYVCGLMQPPVFVPVVGDFYKGMATTVMLPGLDAERVHEALLEHYKEQKLVTVAPLGGDEPVIYAQYACRARQPAADRVWARGADHRHRIVRQSWQGRVGRGGAKYEYYART